jgi:hypothetical protein
MKQIAAALVKAQKGFSPALKTATNPHFKSKYADLASCVEAVVDSLNANGIYLLQQSHECADGVTIETTFIHESGETLSAGRLHVPATKHDAQGYGSALTYARRYSLMAACGMAPEDDDGNAAAKKPQAKGVIKPTSGAGDGLTQEQHDKVKTAVSKVTDWLNADSVEDAVLEKWNAELDADESVLFWTFFDSKQRSAMTKEFERQKQKNLQQNEAQQA